MDLSGEQPAPLFAVPLVVNGVSVGPAIIDTGGGFEVMLREPFGVPLAGSTEVLAFGGVEQVEVTEGFDYVAGSWSASTGGAIVGISACDCNGIGVDFFRKTGAILEIDFVGLGSRFLDSIPDGGVTIPFMHPPAQLSGFDTAFILVEVSVDDEMPVTLNALLDTGSNATVLRRGIAGANGNAILDRTTISIAHSQLGSVTAAASLFDTPDLPDLIIGTDTMRKWADRWYFQYEDAGGAIQVDSNAGNPAAMLAN